MDLKLAIPQYKPVPDLHIETRAKAVKEWLDDLPMANSLDAGRKLTDAIAAANSVAMSDEARIKLLDLYRGAIRTLLPSLQLQFINKPLPLADKAKQSASLTREMLTELANGYKIAALEASKRRMGAGKAATLAIARAMESLGNMLDICYETYSPMPQGAWSDINHLYWYAAHHQLQEHAIAEGSKASIDFIFKQILLIALADPYRLLQGQLNEVKAYLVRFTQYAMLQPLGKADTTHGLFLVRLDGDKPPKALAQHSGVTDARTDILLNTVPLARVLHQQLQDLEAGTPINKLGLPEGARAPAYRELLKRLLKQWGIVPKRMFNRMPKESKTFICNGITSLHYALAQRNLGDDQVEEEGETIITLFVNDPFKATGAHQTYNCTYWRVINESAGGVALAIDPQSYTKIKVGDIIGLGVGASKWGVAIVRWMLAENQNELQLGAQMLAPQAIAIAIKPVISAPDAVYQPALLLPEVPAMKQQARIVAPRGSFQSMREFEVRQDGAMRTVRATMLVEQTDTLELFYFN